MSVGHPPLETAPKPQGHPQHQNMASGQSQGHNHNYGSSEGTGQGQRSMGMDSGTYGDDVGGKSEQHLTTLSQVSFKGTGVGRG